MNNKLNRVIKLEKKMQENSEKVARWALHEVRLAEKANSRPLYKEFRSGESMLTQMDRAAKLTRDYGTHEEYQKALARLSETKTRILRELRKINEKYLNETN